MHRRGTTRRLSWTLIALGSALALGPLAIADDTDDAAEGERAERARQAPASGDEAGLRVRSITLAEKYEEGEPVGESETFSKGRIFAVIQVENPTGAPSEIRVAWVPEGKKGWKGMPLEIPDQARYRTVAMTWATARDPGTYKVVVRDAEGETLAEKTFRIDR